jgi:hypothetical protein
MQPTAQTEIKKGRRGRFTTRAELVLAIDRINSGLSSYLSLANRLGAQRKDINIWLSQNAHLAAGSTSFDPQVDFYRKQFHLSIELEKREKEALRACSWNKGRLASLKAKLAEFDTQPMFFMDGSVVK